MRFSSAAFALAAPLVASAIQFTSPNLNSTVTKGSDYELTWSAVDTDPSKFSVFLVNFVDWPPSYTLLAQDIETASGAASVHVPCSAASSYGYQFNAINGTNVYVIYAQTPKFSIAGADCTDDEQPTTLPPASPSTCAPPATVTVTVSKTTLGLSFSKNSTAAATAPAAAAAKEDVITPTPVAPSSSRAAATSSAPAFQGTCPDTIGWSAGYRHPVTLTKPPRPEHTPTVLPSLLSTAPYPTGGKGALNVVVDAAEDDDEEEDGEPGVTSTVYTTTYLPLSMAPTACAC